MNGPNFDAKTATVELDEPIKFGTDEIRELVIRKPKAGDLRAFPESPTFGDTLDLLATLCGQPKKVINELALEDLKKLTDALGKLSPAFQEIGKSS